MIQDNASGSVRMTTTEGALRLWREIVNGLQNAGYERVLPEYLKLSRVLSQAHLTELLQGRPEAPPWSEIRSLASQALRCLGPLIEAATILAELPSEVAPSGPPAEPPAPQEQAVPRSPEPTERPPQARRSRGAKKPDAAGTGAQAASGRRKAAGRKPAPAAKSVRRGKSLK